MEAPARPDATAPAAEDQLATLQEEIRRVGRAYEQAAIWMGSIFILTLVGAAVVTRLGMAAGGLLVIGLSLAALVLVTGVGTLLCYLYSPLSRTARRRAILRKIESLPAHQQAAVLVPLRAETAGDTRQLIEPLLRELGLPTELTPAGTPEGSGAEVSAGGEA